METQKLLSNEGFNQDGRSSASGADESLLRRQQPDETTAPEEVDENIFLYCFALFCFYIITPIKSDAMIMEFLMEFLMEEFESRFTTTATPTEIYLLFGIVCGMICCIICCIIGWIVRGFVYMCLLLFGFPIVFLSMISVLVFRVFQLIIQVKKQKRVTLVRLMVIYCLLCFITVMNQFMLWTHVYPLVRYFPGLKQLMFLQLPLTKWVSIVSVLCGIYFLNLLLKFCIEVPAYFLLHDRSGLAVVNAITELIENLFFWWMAQKVFNSVPSFKDHEMLGLSTRIWVDVLIFVLMAYNLINLFIHMVLIFSIGCNPRSGSKTNVVGYYARGLTVSISFVINSFQLLLTWTYFFGSHLDLKSGNVRMIWEYGKWTLLCLLIYSVLQFIKTVILLFWEAKNVYGSFQRQVISNSKQLYFLGLLSHNTRSHDVLGLRHNIHDIEEKALEKVFDDLGLFIFINLFKNDDLEEHGNVEQKREKARDKLLVEKHAESTVNAMQRESTVDGIQQAASYFLSAKKYLLEERSFIDDILSQFNKQGTDDDIRKELKDLIILNEITNDGTQNPSKTDKVEDAQQQQQQRDVAETSANNSRSKGDPKTIQVEQQDDEDSSNHKDWAMFLKTLGVTNQKKMNSDSEILFSDIQTWVERAHNQCVNLANMLSNAKEVAECLNNTISSILIVAIFILWLFLTGLATAKVFVLIGSPLLAATFIFEDTCKTLFQGFIFVYVVRPFNVGDLCVIDDRKMEVRSIGIWTTTFTNLDKFGVAQESVVYFNSKFTSKTIINRKTKFNWSDREEFILSNVKLTNKEEEKDVIDFFMDRLKPGSDKYFLTVDKEARKYSFLSRNPDISVIPGEEEKVTLVIRLEYDSQSAADWTYSQCFRQKDRLRGQFHLYMKHVISEYMREREKGKKPM